MRSYTLDLGDSPHANSAPVAPSTAAPLASEPALPPATDATAAGASQPVAAGLPKVASSEVPVAAPPLPVPVPAVHPRMHPPAPPAAWTVQLATFSSRENAARLVIRLKSRGFGGSIVEATKNGHKLFRVRVGAERDRAAAQKLLGRLKAAGERGGQVVAR
ncbi:MAG: SPOR domain-containing protein [Steroidobacteraceae bacterium]